MSGETNYEVMKDLQGYFNPGETKKIYNAAESFRDKVLIRLLWKTGRRISEILLVRVKDIDFNDAAIVWHILKKSKKKGKVRVKFDLRSRIPIDSFTFKLLQSYISQYDLKDNDLLFQSPVNPTKPISRQRAFGIVRRLCDKAEIYYVGNKQPHPHHFRHTFAVEMSKRLRNPADLEKLRRILEHANLGITQTYLQFGDEELRDLIEEE